MGDTVALTPLPPTGALKTRGITVILSWYEVSALYLPWDFLDTSYRNFGRPASRQMCLIGRENADATLSLLNIVPRCWFLYIIMEKIKDLETVRLGSGLLKDIFSSWAEASVGRIAENPRCCTFESNTGRYQFTLKLCAFQLLWTLIYTIFRSQCKVLNIYLKTRIWKCE